MIRYEVGKRYELDLVKPSAGAEPVGWLYAANPTWFYMTKPGALSLFIPVYGILESLCQK